MLNKLFKFLLFTTILFIPFYVLRFSIFSIPSTILESFIYLAFVVALIAGRFKKIKNHTPIYLAAAFVVAGLVAVFFDPDKFAALGVWKAYFFDGFLFFLMILTLQEKRERLRAMYYLVLSAVILSLVALGMYLVGIKSPDGRLYDLARLSPNYLAMFLAPALTMALALIVQIKDKWSRVYLGLGSLILALALCLTDSRGGFLAALAGIFAIGYYGASKKWGRKVAGAAFIVALIVLIAGAAYYFRPQNNSFARAGASSNIRYYIWTTSLEIAREQPVLGVGLTNFQNYFTNLTYGRPNYTEYIAPQALTAHNLYLHIYLTMGLLGIASFLGLVIFSRFWRFKEVAATSAFIAILVLGLFDTPFFRNDLAILFWLILALVYTFNLDKKAVR